MELVGKGDEGKLNVKYATQPLPTESQLTILDTDYDNYAVVWSCNGFGPVHARKLKPFKVLEINKKLDIYKYTLIRFLSAKNFFMLQMSFIS